MAATQMKSLCSSLGTLARNGLTVAPELPYSCVTGA